MTDAYGSGGDETRFYTEASYGVAPGAITWKRLNGLGIDITPSPVVNTRRVPGSMLATTSTLDDDWTTGSYEGAIDFNALGIVFQSLFGYAVPTSLGSGAYERIWTWDGRRPKRPVSYGLSSGYPDRARFASGWIFNTLSLSGGRPDGFEVSGDGFAKVATEDNLLGGITREVQQIAVSGTVSGGTYTITITETGETTAAIAFGANAATVQAAIDLLGSIYPGDIVVAGGSLPGTPMTLTFDGPVFAGRDIAAITVNSGSLTGGGSYVVTTTTPGADAVTDLAPVPSGAMDGSLYLDSTWAGLGTSRALNLYSSEFTIPERFARVMPTNKLLTSDSIIDVADQTGMQFAGTFGLNEFSEAQLVSLRAMQKVFVRQEWEDGLIGGAFNYRLQIDTALLWKEFGENTDANNVQANQLTGEVVIDTTNAIRIALRNGVATY